MVSSFSLLSPARELPGRPITDTPSSAPWSFKGSGIDLFISLVRGFVSCRRRSGIVGGTGVVLGVVSSLASIKVHRFRPEIIQLYEHLGFHNHRCIVHQEASKFFKFCPIEGLSEKVSQLVIGFYPLNFDSIVVYKFSNVMIFQMYYMLQ